MKSIEVLSTGPLSTIQDHGRIGYSSIGVGRAGAADLTSHDTANRLVGNMAGAATVETMLGGLRIRARGRVVAAVTGAAAPVTINGVADGMNCTLILSDGDELAVGTAPSGLRIYVAVRGGIDVDPVLGSRSTDTMSDLGPAQLSAGDTLDIGNKADDWPAATWATPRVEIGPIRVILGPRDDWFADTGLLFEQEWTVTSDADRVGVRLDGDSPLERSHAAELPSEGMVVGALQVPPDGKPVVFLADHPVTGGYPVIGVVMDDDLPRLGQLRPGDIVRFAPG